MKRRSGNYVFEFLRSQKDQNDTGTMDRLKLQSTIQVDVIGTMKVQESSHPLEMCHGFEIDSC